MGRGGMYIKIVFCKVVVEVVDTDFAAWRNSVGACQLCLEI